ncbi:ring-opening amidohydrolase [Celeribacter indicus]|uniref:Cyclic amide hydrolase n=2 Tax=Celeribacter indicus TaxID=1208324 RepID=A0A0B5E393_9RHOB|nr:ring-opening amidohydrolase [Celeribacter indicus]
MNAPDDVSGLKALICSGTLAPAEIVAVIGKTEGNGGANDFTRALATRALADLIADATDSTRAEILERVLMIWSGGCEGVLSPHATVFTHTPATEAAPGKTLVLGLARTRAILPEEIGTIAQARLTAEAVRKAMANAGLSAAEDVHYVQIKGPLLTPGRIADADARGAPLVSRDGNLSKPLARGILALGVAQGLGEVAEADLVQENVLADMGLFSRVASTSVGGEVDCVEVALMGNAEGGGSRFRIGHGMLASVVDADGIRAAHDDAGGGAIAAIFAKAEPAARVLGLRTTMMSDADVHAERHARAALSAVIAATTGRTAVFISGGTEHQCPEGAAPIAIICEV